MLDKRKNNFINSITIFQSFIYAAFELLVMTSYGRYSPYEAPSSFEEWLGKKGISPTFVTVFSWSKPDVLSTHEEYNKKLEVIIEQIGERTAEYEALHESRIAYMIKHGIDNWHQLDPIKDIEHLTIKNSLFSSIEISVTEGKRLKNERIGIKASIPLLAGILVGTYTSFSSIIDEERSKHGKSHGMGYPNFKKTYNKFELRDLKKSQLGTHRIASKP